MERSKLLSVVWCRVSGGPPGPLLTIPCALRGWPLRTASAELPCPSLGNEELLDNLLRRVMIGYFMDELIFLRWSYRMSRSSLGEEGWEGHYKKRKQPIQRE